MKKSATDYDTQWAAAGADLIYDGDFASGPTYKDGEIVVYNNIAYIATMPTTSPPTAWPGGQASPAGPPALTISYSTSLPGSPFDGQEAILVDSLTNPSYTWRFRYNAGSTSAYKWEFVGGAEKSDSWSPGMYPFTATSWAVVTGGPTLAAPRAGEYVIRFGVRFQSFGTTQGDAFLTIMGAGPRAQFSTGSGAAQYGAGSVMTESKYTLAAAGLYTLYAQVGAGTWSVDTAFVALRPQRVS